MTDKQLFSLTELNSEDLAGDMGVYLVDPDTGSRYVTLAELKEFINTDPTVIPSAYPYRGALVYRTSGITGVSNNDTIAWQAAAYDTDDFWTIASPTRFTIPEGVTKVRLYGGLDWETGAVAGTVSSYLQKNGSDFNGTTDFFSRISFRSVASTGFTSNRHSVVSSVISVGQGDYFEYAASVSMSGIDEIRATNTTYFEIEVIEAST